ncbi:MAG: ribosome silencing factor [Chloroflexi bacterium RBG_13_66_10]|jgi:ribosome-associated protein|nr:MAG: ribosome silencing factor [Chloroflexi bacterium RBG_13_66_10]
MPAEALTLAHAIVGALEAKKGEDILLLDLLGVCSFTDYFVLCTCSSERTLQALGDDLLEQVRVPQSRSSPRKEGDAQSGWVLLDYGGVVVHLLSPSARDYYKLEDLWSAGRVLLRVQ